MSGVNEHKVKSLTEFVELIERYQSQTQTPLWYRGCGQSSHGLIPSLYRGDTIDATNIAQLEQDIMLHFKQRSISMTPRSFENDWDHLFFMQHYRIPTRLLDWTENPLIALYFAVMSAKFEMTKTGHQKFFNPAAVWFLNPVSWNHHALTHQSYSDGVLNVGDDALTGYQPRRTFDGMNKSPVALYGAHNSPRIVAQRGVFVIFGRQVCPMEDSFLVDSFPEECLTKVVFSPRFLPSLRKSILVHGVTESAVFPDLEGLAMEIRRNFGFEK